MKTAGALLAFLHLCCLPALAGDTDAVALGLRGPVASLEERITSFSTGQSGSRREYTTTSEAFEFTRGGMKSVEYGYNRSSRTEYAYDEQARLVGFTTYRSGRRSEVWTRVFDGAASTVTETTYSTGAGNPVIERRVERFDPAGHLVESVTTSAQNIKTEWWRREDGTDGHSVRLEERDGNGRLSYEERSEFDSTGAITLRYRRWSGEPADTWRYIYDAEGRLVEGTYSAAAGQVRKWALSYTELGGLSEVRRLREDGSLLCHRVYVYSGGALLEQRSTWYAEEERPQSEWVYRYDARGNTVAETYRRLDPSFSISFDYDVDGSDRPTRATAYTTEGEVFSEQIVAYDGAGSVVSSMYSGRYVSYPSGWLNEYDSAGRLIEYVGLDGQGRITGRTSSSFDEMGQQTEYATYYPDGSLKSRRVFRYEYDRHGNWTVKRQLDTDNAAETYDVESTVWRRNIVYFDSPSD